MVGSIEQVLLIVCGVAIVIYILWRVDQHREHKEKLLSAEWETKRLSDEGIAKAHTEFEKRLEQEIDLPDGIRGRDAFVYWNLMCTWVASVIAAKRYSDTGSDKLRSDWLEYMGLMDERARLNFLAAETENEEKRNEYLEEAHAARRKMTVIEDGVAAAIGQEAVAQLKDVRSRKYDAFDRSGKKPMAPIGYHYFPTSIRPYVDELVPDDKELFPRVHAEERTCY
jgi:hypothetical protein